MHIKYEISIFSSSYYYLFEFLRDEGKGRRNLIASRVRVNGGQ